MGRLQGTTTGASIHSNCHGILRAELIGQDAQTILNQRKFVLWLHRATDVHQEDQVRRRPLVPGDLPALNSHAEKPMLGSPWTGGDFRNAGEWIFSRRLRVIITEVVQQLLDTYGTSWWNLIRFEKPADVCIAARIDVHAEGGQLVFLCREERVINDAV